MDSFQISHRCFILSFFLSSFFLSVFCSFFLSFLSFFLCAAYFCLTHALLSPQDLIADLDFLRYAWEATLVESGGASFVLVRPKEAAIDQRRWCRAVAEAQTGSGGVAESPVDSGGGSGAGIGGGNGGGNGALPIEWNGDNSGDGGGSGNNDDDSGSRFDLEEWVENEMKVSLDPAVMSSTTSTALTATTASTTTTSLSNNLDRWAKWRITEEDLRPKEAIKSEPKLAKTKKRIILASRCPVPVKLENRKIIDLIRNSQVAIEIIKQDPHKAIDNLIEFFGTR